MRTEQMIDMDVKVFFLLRKFGNGLLYLIGKFYCLNFQKRTTEKALACISVRPSFNTVLKTDQEVAQSVQILKKLSLWLPLDRVKSWDACRAFSFILEKGNTHSVVLDVGCAAYGVILPWLEAYGFSNLFGCDISFKKDFQKGKIKYSKQDLHKTNLPSNYFDFITSLSVIEHGVNVDAYLKEMSRLLKKGGYLVTSTDYWPEPIDTNGIFPYGKGFGQMKVFNRGDIEGLVQRAKDYCLELVAPVDFIYRDKVVHWERVGREFTFIFFILTKKKPALGCKKGRLLSVSACIKHACLIIPVFI